MGFIHIKLSRHFRQFTDSFDQGNSGTQQKKMTRDLLYFRSPLNTRHTEKIHKVPLYSTIIINMILVITAFTAELQHVRHCALSFDKNKVNDIWMVNNTSEKSHSQSQSAD